jgi:putative OmpL-like beta-barrel porin-2
MSKTQKLTLVAALTLAAFLLPSRFAAAGETVIVTKDGKAAKEAKQVEEVKPRFTIYGWIESGITWNVDSPNDHQNFGRLFDDRNLEPLLNQAAITFERTLDPKATGFDWGFKAQFLFGSDARFFHSMGLFDRTLKNERMQPDVTEAYLNLHFPVLTEGGVDVKVGKFVTLEGAETIDPRTNFFYSHTYIFNFGIPFNHTGFLADIHATKIVDIYAGLTRGVNTSIEDNNGAEAFHGGIGLTFNEGKFVVLASTSIGPETPHNSTDLRYLNDITATWKITDKLTSITDLNFIRDDAASADGFGVAQYFTYAFNDTVSLGVRGEVWRDDKGFYVAQFADNHDPMRALRGETITDPRTVGGGPNTYGAITLGVNVKVPVPKPLAGLVIRPELRVDHAFDNAAFNDSHDHTMFTAALDAILTF